VRLFAAILPPDDVLDSLEAELARVAGAAELRWTSRAAWHLTLAFYGEDDLRRRAEWLAPRLAGHAPLRLELRGAGTFTGVLWAGVGGDLDGLHALGSAAGAGASDGRPYHPHLTLARWRQPRRPSAARQVVEGMTAYRGPSWLAADVVLMRSEPVRGQHIYTVQERFELPG
jgi:2'-5' RNA ligase